MKYHLISASLLGLAVVLDAAGSAGAVLLLAAGVACETWFWMRVARRRRTSSRVTHTN
jgi:hypothetical protein